MPSVRGHFAPIKQWTLLTENILYQLLGVRAIPVLCKFGPIKRSRLYIFSAGTTGGVLGVRIGYLLSHNLSIYTVYIPP